MYAVARGPAVSVVPRVSCGADRWVLPLPTVAAVGKVAALLSVTGGGGGVAGGAGGW